MCKAGCHFTREYTAVKISHVFAWWTEPSLLRTALTRHCWSIMWLSGPRGLMLNVYLRVQMFDRLKWLICLEEVTEKLDNGIKFLDFHARLASFSYRNGCSLGKCRPFITVGMYHFPLAGPLITIIHLNWHNLHVCTWLILFLR